MATISSTMAFVAAAIPSPALGLRCRCSRKASSALSPLVAKGVPLLAVASTTAASAAPMLASPVALVDKRMSSEGTGLSNDLLAAIGLVLSFYTVYSSTFDDDDDQPAAASCSERLHHLLLPA